MGIISDCPDDLDEMSAELLRVAAKGIDEKLVAKAGEYLAVSRYGLRKSDLAELLGENWTEVKFSHLINFMYDCFMVRDDGRYDFMHKSIRAGFLKKCDREKLNLEIFNHLKALPDNDPVRIAEVVYHAIQADDKRFFIDYIIKYKYNKDKSYINQSALDTYQQCISDKGRWICDILGNFELFDSTRPTNFINFIAFELNKKFTGKLYELYIQLDILTANKIFAEYADSQLQTSNSKRDVLLSCEFLGYVYENIGGMTNFNRALELYQKKLELSEQISASENTIESKRDLSISYNKIAYIYEQLCGKDNLQKALEMYQKCLDIFEQLSASENTIESKRDLSVSYEMVASIYEKLGGKNNLLKALDLYQKAFELSEQLSASENTSESKRDLSISYGHIGRIYEYLGGNDNLHEALKMYQKYMELSEQRSASENTSESKRELSVSYNMVAGIYKQLSGNDNLQKTLELYQKSLDMREQIYASENTIKSKRDLSVSYERVAGVYAKFGGNDNLRKALELYQKSLVLAEQLSASEDTSLNKRDLSTIYSKLADVYEQLGGKDNLQKALELYQKSLVLAEQLSASENTINAYDDLAVSLYKVAMHPYTDKQTKKQLLERGFEVAKMLYDNLPNERYKTFLMMFYKELIGMGE